MQFLKTAAKREERLSIIVAGFRSTKIENNKQLKKKINSNSEYLWNKTSTEGSLLTTNTSLNVRKICIFC